MEQVLRVSLGSIELKIRTSAQRLAIGCRAGRSLSLDLINLLANLLVLWGVEPYILPVSIADTGGNTGTNSFQHILSGIHVRWANSALAGEVLPNDGRVLANVAEINSLATPLEKEQPVKALE